MILGSTASAPEGGKGWLVGPWNSTVPIAVGWADRGVDEPHRHEQMNEISWRAGGA